MKPGVETKGAVLSTEDEKWGSFIGLGKGRKKFLTKLVWTVAGFSIVLGVGLWAGGQIGAGVKGLTSLR